MILRKYKTIFLGIILIFSAHSCSKSEEASLQKGTVLENAKVYAGKSEEFYNRAITDYKIAIKTQQNNQSIYYQLGALYYAHGKYVKAIEALKNSDQEFSKRLLAICFYKSGNYTDALSVFEKLEKLDDESLYYYAVTCEKHNLHTKALEIYARIKGSDFQKEAQQRIKSINALKEKTNLEGLDQKTRDLIVQAPSQEDFPQARAIVLFSKEDIDVTDDRSIVYVEHYIIKILNERGKALGEIQIPYDSTYEKVDIDFARIIKPDGEVISVGSKHIRDVSRYLNFPLYSNARVKIISMPEVSVGACLEYKVKTFRSKMIADDKFNTGHYLEHKDPIQYSEVNISLPKEQKLNIKILNRSFNRQNINLNPTVSSKGKKILYSWKFSDIDQIIPEPRMPPLAEITPVILSTTFNTWEEIYSWWWDLAKDKIVSNSDMKDKVKELVFGLKDIREKARAIYNFCARDIRYVGIEYGQAGYEPHSAIEIFSNKYGDCKDQAILLISMLKEIGVEAYPVLIGTKGLPFLQEDFPMLLFNHCIAVAEIEGNYVFLDPTGETVLFDDLPQGDQGRDVFVCLKDQGRVLRTPKFPAKHNAVFKKTVLRFETKENINAQRRVETSGIFDQAQRGWLRYTMPILIKEHLQETIQGIIPGSQLIAYEIKNLDTMFKDIILSYSFKGSDFLIRAGEKMRVVPQLGGIDLALVSKQERLFAIDFSVPRSIIKILEIDLPLKYRIVSLPKSIRSDTPWFSYENIYEKKDRKIVFTEKNIFKVDRIGREDYLAYKNALEKLSKEIRQSIILEK